MARRSLTRVGRSWTVGPSLAALLALTACQGAVATPRSVPPQARSGSTTSSTSTTVAGPVFPFTGVPSSAAAATRPALSVKIDNVDPARPQSGVNDADLVFETLVEGGNSRLFAVYQSHDSPLIGPVRSARPVDADLLHAVGGIFAYSGAAAAEIAPVKDHSGAVLLSEELGSPGFARDGRRPAPYNLYVSSQPLYAAAAPSHPTAPRPFFTYGPAAGGAPFREVDLAFAQRISSNWQWNPGTRLYERTQNGLADVQRDGSLITATNVVIMSVQIAGTGIFDTVHEEDPFVKVIGSGAAWALRDGRVVQGTWQRPGLDSQTQLLGSGGAPLRLAPGRTWVELLPAGVQPQFK